MAFSQKQLAATFSYGGGGGAQGGQVGAGPYTTPNGLRMSARIVLPGGQDYGTMNLALYGMTSSHMNALTVLPFGLTSVGNNTVTLMAGDNTGALSIVFKGTVRSAFADLHEQPEGCFRIQAYGAMFQKVAAAPAFSATGTSDVATVVQQLSTAAGFKFENSGVNVKLQRVNLPGSYMQQIAAICQHAVFSGLTITIRSQSIQPARLVIYHLLRYRLVQVWSAIRASPHLVSSSRPCTSQPSSSERRLVCRADYLKRLARGLFIT